MFSEHLEISHEMGHHIIFSILLSFVIIRSFQFKAKCATCVLLMNASSLMFVMFLKAAWSFDCVLSRLLDK